jgi:hypothetical protein
MTRTSDLPEDFTRSAPSAAGDRLLRLSSTELHDRIGFKETTIRQLVRDGQLRASTICGTLVIALSEVDRFVAAAAAVARQGGSERQTELSNPTPTGPLRKL